MAILPKWKNGEKIIEDYGLIVYPRPGAKLDNAPKHNNITYIDAPLLDISATFVRNCVREGKSIRYLVPEKAAEYIESKKLYL